MWKSGGRGWLARWDCYMHYNIQYISSWMDQVELVVQLFIQLLKEERGISLVLDGLMTYSYQGDISTIYTTWTD